MKNLTHHLVIASVGASLLMTSGGYLARSFNAEPVRANVIPSGGACNWYSCKRQPRDIKPADKSALTMRISALTGERMR